MHKFSTSVEKSLDVYVINKVITFMIQFRCPLSMMTSSDGELNFVVNNLSAMTLHFDQLRLPMKAPYVKIETLKEFGDKRESPWMMQDMFR
jgi:hypothetical protein